MTIQVTKKDGQVLSKKITLAFYLLALVQGTLIFTIAIILIPLPNIGRELGLGASDLLLVSAGYGLPYSGLLLFGGRLSDKYGGRKMFLLGISLFGIASVVAGFAHTFEMLVAMRFTQGIGAAFTAPAAVAILQSLYPSQATFNKAMATWGGVSVLGAILGPLLSGLVTNWVSWRWMFVVPVSISVLVLIVTPKLVPAAVADRVKGTDQRLDLAGALLATFGISVSSYGLINSGEHPWSSTIVLAPLFIGFALLAVFFLIEKKVNDPLLPPGFIMEARRAVGLIGMLLAAAASGLLMFLLSLCLQQQKGWSVLETTGAYIPFAISLMMTNAFTGSLVGKFRAGVVTIAGLLIGTVGLLLLSGMDKDSTFAWDILPGLIVLPIGLSLLFAGSAVLSTSNVAEHQIGLAGGVMNTAMELGPTVGLAVFMAVAATQNDAIVGYALAFWAAGIAYFIMAGIAFIILRKHRQ